MVATFLLAEILPNVRDRYASTDDPDHWAIGGGEFWRHLRSDRRVDAA